MLCGLRLVWRKFCSEIHVLFLLRNSIKMKVDFMTEPIIRKHLIFSGAVQGVGFRWRAVQAAKAADATGWVRNDRFGTVAMELQGSEGQIERVIRTLDRAPWIRIDSIHAHGIPVDPDERSFAVLDDRW